METIPCFLCGRDQTQLMFTRRDDVFRVSSEPFRVVRCIHCGLVYVNPRPTETEIHAYYTDTFYDVSVSRERLLEERAKQIEQKFAYVKDLPPGRMLDIGCQKGEFMYHMRRLGWEVHGTEFSSRPPNLFELPIYYGPLEDSGFEPGSFDLVTIWAVLEHDYDPMRTLRQASRLLRTGGVIVILVTNFESLPACFMRHDDVPRHTTLFTKRTLGKALELTGFGEARFDWNCELFGGSHRGLLNYLAKRWSGESMEEIVAMARSQDRWDEFSTMIQGKTSKAMLKIDRWDIALSPHLDRLADQLGAGFIMIARASKVRQI